MSLTVCDIYYGHLHLIIVVSGQLAIWICIHIESIGASLDDRFSLPLVAHISFDNPTGGYDSSVRMAEEASNVTTVIPWAIVSGTRNIV